MKYEIKQLIIGDQIIDNFNANDDDILLENNGIFEFKLGFENARKYLILSQILHVKEIK